jgi:hypothetical protein
MKFISTKKTFEISLDNAVEMFAEAIGTTKEKAKVEYVIREVGADLMDRFPGTKQVTAIRITVSE